MTGSIQKLGAAFCIVVGLAGTIRAADLDDPASPPPTSAEIAKLKHNSTSKRK